MRFVSHLSLTQASVLQALHQQSTVNRIDRGAPISTDSFPFGQSFFLDYGIGATVSANTPPPNLVFPRDRREPERVTLFAYQSSQPNERMQSIRGQSVECDTVLADHPRRCRGDPQPLLATPLMLARSGTFVAQRRVHRDRERAGPCFPTFRRRLPDGGVLGPGNMVGVVFDGAATSSPTCSRRWLARSGALTQRTAVQLARGWHTAARVV